MRWKIAIGALAAAAAVGAAIYAGAIGFGGTRSASGVTAGVGVHGHWTIEVSDPDGTLKERRSFDNAFVGALTLRGILSREATVGLWGIGDVGLCAAGAVNDACLINEGNGNLDVGISRDGLLFIGRGVAGRDGSINRVSMVLFTCPASDSPVECARRNDRGFRLFTQTDVAPAVPFRRNQQAQITVEMSFGTLP